jgi:hypothetical protein
MLGQMSDIYRYFNMNSDKMAGLLLVLKMLERSAVKVASCVLRGAGRSNVVSLLGDPCLHP